MYRLTINSNFFGDFELLGEALDYIRYMIEEVWDGAPEKNLKIDIEKLDT